MCLSVYLGSSIPIEQLPASESGAVAIEPASWRPPAFWSVYEHIYLVGDNRCAPHLGCSCMFLEFLRYEDSGVFIDSEDNFPDEGPCPFDVLRTLISRNMDRGASIMIACDDSGGLPQDCDQETYDEACIRLHRIQRYELLFPVNPAMPWRRMSVVEPGKH